MEYVYNDGRYEVYHLAYNTMNYMYFYIYLGVIDFWGLGLGGGDGDRASDDSDSDLRCLPFLSW